VDQVALFDHGFSRNVVLLMEAVSSPRENSKLLFQKLEENASINFCVCLKNKEKNE
jgi:hypothetical protein